MRHWQWGSCFLVLFALLPSARGEGIDGNQPAPSAFSPPAAASPVGPAPTAAPQPYVDPTAGNPPAPYAPVPFTPQPYSAYPQCPAGMYFDGMQSCLPAPSRPIQTWEDVEEARKQAAREQERMKPSFTLDAEGMIGLMGNADVPVITPTVAVLAGFRRNFSPRFGMMFRGGVLAGMATFDESSKDASSTTDSTNMLGVMGEFIPFWGPFGRFYVGPSAWAGRLSFGKSELWSGERFVSLRSDFTVGLGAHCGFLLGDEEHTVLSFGTRLSDLNGLTMLMTAAIGFRL